MIRSDQGPYWALPDPELKPEFYTDVPAKRLIAWVIDTVAISILTAMIVPFTAFTALLFLPFLFLVVGFVYRVGSIARWSATPGMLFTALEFRRRDAAQFDPMTAFLHTAGYTICSAIVVAQVISVALMLFTPRRQGLSDLVLGTVALNRAAVT